MTVSKEIWCPLLLTILSASVVNAALRNIEFVNNCNQRIWVGSQGKPLPFKGGFQLDAKKSAVKQIPGNTEAARFWPRTGCRTENGRFICQTGDCGAPPNNFGMECNGIGGQPPATLAEFTFLEGANQADFYDLSNVDGYNIPMKIEPVGGSKAPGAPVDKFNCGAPRCTMDLSKCPAELKMDKGGTVVCASICAAVNNAEQRGKFPALKAIFDNPEKRALVCCECLCPPNSGDCNCKNPKSKYCCSPYNKPSGLENGGKCRVEEWPLASTKGRYDAVFKNACPDAYSWQFDDHQSTYVCAKANYRITFC